METRASPLEQWRSHYGIDDPACRVKRTRACRPDRASSCSLPEWTKQRVKPRYESSTLTGKPQHIRQHISRPIAYQMSPGYEKQTTYDSHWTRSSPVLLREKADGGLHPGQDFQATYYILAAHLQVEVDQSQAFPRRTRDVEALHTLNAQVIPIDRDHLNPAI